MVVALSLLSAILLVGFFYVLFYGGLYGSLDWIMGNAAHAGYGYATSQPRSRAVTIPGATRPRITRNGRSAA